MELKFDSCLKSLWQKTRSVLRKSPARSKANKSRHTWLCTRVYCRIRERERGTHVSAPTLSLQGPFITILGYLCLHTPIRQRRTLMSPPHPYHSARDLNELYPNSSAVLTRSICLLPLSVSGCALIRRQIWMHAPCATRQREREYLFCQSVQPTTLIEQ